MTKRHVVFFFILIFGGLIYILLQASMPPATSSIVIPTGSLSPEPSVSNEAALDDISVTAPTKKAQVTSPITISGKAKGSWFFEGSFPVTLTNWDGLIIAEGYVTAIGDWMTPDFVPFKGTLKYTLPPETPYKRGFLILRKNNPSDNSALDKSLEIEVQL